MPRFPLVAAAIVMATTLFVWFTPSRSPVTSYGETFIGRTMPCGHVYAGKSVVDHGTRWFLCEVGDRWPQQNAGGLYAAAQDAPIPTPLPVKRPMPIAARGVGGWVGGKPLFDPGFDR